MPILFKLHNLKDFIDTNSVFTSSLASDRCDVVIVFITAHLSGCVSVHCRRRCQLMSE